MATETLPVPAHHVRSGDRIEYPNGASFTVRAVRPTDDGTAVEIPGVYRPARASRRTLPTEVFETRILRAGDVVLVRRRVAA